MDRNMVREADLCRPTKNTFVKAIDRLHRLEKLAIEAGLLVGGILDRVEGPQPCNSAPTAREPESYALIDRAHYRAGSIEDVLNGILGSLRRLDEAIGSDEAKSARIG